MLVGDARSRTVRAYRSNGRTFEKLDAALTRLASENETWIVEESALIGPDGTRLARLPGHLAYWFAWNGYLGEAELSGNEAKE